MAKITPASGTRLFLFLSLGTLTISCMPQLSVWEQESFFAPQDIIIIGSGFVGLWSAVKLAERFPGKSISVLERGMIPTGASTRNAGFSCFGSPSELLQDIQLMGEDKTFSLVEMRYRGLQQIQHYFTPDETGFDGSGGYECFTKDSADWAISRDQLDWLNRQMKSITGLDDTYQLADEKLEIFGFRGFAHLVENRLEGGIHSGKLIKALLRRAHLAGVQVLTGMDVCSYTRVGGELEIQTRQELRMRCKQLLLCTNAFTRALLPEADIIPNRGQVLLTAPLPGLRFRGTFHFDQGYYYFRNLGDRLLLGGARNKDFENESTTEIAITTHIQEELERFARTHLLPDMPFEIASRWSGIMAMGAEKTPLIREVEKDVFCCVRMSGMGVALAPEVADRVTALMSQAG